MKSTIEKMISLGFGLASAGKEQIEKTMDELVKKGEVSREESKALIEGLVKRGEETQQHMESTIKERVQSMIGDKSSAALERIEALERRIQQLEERGAGS